MRTLVVFALVLFTAVEVWPQPDASIRKRFKSKDYAVTWATPPRYPSVAKLEVGDGSGHGGTLGWLRFQPGNDGVEILSIQLESPSWRPNPSRWSRDEVRVTLKRGTLPLARYEKLLRDIAIVSSARLKPIQRNSLTFSSGDFWVAATLSQHDRSLLDLNWAGYPSSIAEIEYAKPDAVVNLTREAIADIPLREDSLSRTDRSWASAKFLREWKEISNREFHWWVAERYLITIGVLGDKTVIPTLTQVMQAKISDGPDDRRIYYAINAITRLTGKDVRPRPVEEMDLESTRKMVLETLKASE
jgi:hypothetical protein